MNRTDAEEAAQAQLPCYKVRGWESQQHSLLSVALFVCLGYAENQAQALRHAGQLLHSIPKVNPPEDPTQDLDSLSMCSSTWDSGVTKVTLTSEEWFAMESEAIKQTEL